jgi:hypothetical protein
MTKENERKKKVNLSKPERSIGSWAHTGDHSQGDEEEPNTQSKGHAIHSANTHTPRERERRKENSRMKKEDTEGNNERKKRRKRTETYFSELHNSKS